MCGKQKKISHRDLRYISSIESYHQIKENYIFTLEGKTTLSNKITPFFDGTIYLSMYQNDSTTKIISDTFPPSCYDMNVSFRVILK